MTPEQRRRVDRVIAETRGLPMAKRLEVAKQFMLPPVSHFAPELWDSSLDKWLEEITPHD